MKAKCKNCYEWFVLTKEEEALYLAGECSMPSQCQDCFDATEHSGQEDDYPHSDADSGL